VSLTNILIKRLYSSLRTWYKNVLSPQFDNLNSLRTETFSRLNQP